MFSHERDASKGIELIKFAEREGKADLSICMEKFIFSDGFRTARKCGAVGRVDKPLFNIDKLREQIEYARENKSEKLRRERFVAQNLRPDELRKYPDGVVLSAKHRAEIAELAESYSMPGMIYGEPGSGRREMGRLLHRIRMQEEGLSLPMVIVNCEHIKGRQGDAILFGAVAEGFPEAKCDKEGALAFAGEGILFLSEVDHLSPSSQKRLLRFLQDGSYQNEGDTHWWALNKVQVIASSSQSCARLLASGKLDRELHLCLRRYHSIKMESLRSRPGDLEALISLYFKKHGGMTSYKEIPKLAQVFKKHRLPGNIGEMYQVLEFLKMGCDQEDVPITATEGLQLCDGYLELMGLLQYNKGKKFQDLHMGDYPAVRFDIDRQPHWVPFYG